jgi:hypothetical protein
MNSLPPLNDLAVTAIAVATTTTTVSVQVRLMILIGSSNQSSPEALNAAPSLNKLSDNMVAATTRHRPRVLHSLQVQEGPGQHKLLETRLVRARHQKASRRDGPTPWKI